MSELNRAPNTAPHALPENLAAQNIICDVCGAKFVNGKGAPAPEYSARSDPADRAVANAARGGII